MIVLTIHDSFLLLAITLISNNWAIEQLYLGNERMNTPTYNIDREGYFPFNCQFTSSH